MLALDLIVFLVSLFVLILSAEWAVRILSKISRQTGVREYVMGFVLVSVSTSIPELFVGISSAISGEAALSLGNVIGSNVVNFSLIMGILVILGKGLKISSGIVKNEMVYMLMIAVLPVFLMLDGNLSRIEGFILMAVFLVYTISFIKMRHKSDPSVVKDKKAILLSVLSLIVSFALLFASSHFVVDSGVKMAFDFGVPVMVVGLLAVAFGTSIPELIFTIKAANKKALAFADLTGSVIANSSLVLGATAIISPITADFRLFLISATFMIVNLFLVITFAQRKEGISVTKGIFLVILYLAFILIEFIR